MSLPSPLGKVEVIYSLHNRTLSLNRPPSNQHPLGDLSFLHLCSCLSVDNILCIISCLLCESQVVIHSSHISLLNPTCEALLSLMFPLVWQGAYVPVMPEGLMDMLEGMGGVHNWGPRIIPSYAYYLYTFRLKPHRLIFYFFMSIL